ncbi:MAG TPA: gliding motility-associated C-terminal domain-containing protein, partial [Saprospiraceae bacterium]|nr:gliding motility-associated C-terminal domain-containing protein [Saprospiraceae bacterium]
MSKFLLRLFPAALLFVWFQRSAVAGCVDSVRLEIKSVQCFGLRNGVVHVDTVFGGEKPFFYSIDGQSYSTNPTFDHLWPGDYILYVRDASNCVRQWPVRVSEPEELLVHLFSGKDVTAAGESFELKAVVTPEGISLQAIEWRPPDLFQRQDTLVQSVQISETTTFAVEVQTKDGCIARDQATVEVEKTNLYFPNVIKPGSNQDAYFTLFAGTGIARIVKMQVYSRGGGLVFERQDFAPNDPVKGWNGRWQGKYVQPGVYPWSTVVEYQDGKQEMFRGTV